MTVLASTIECASVKLPWQPVLKLLSSPTFILLGKSPQLTSALSNGWWEVIVWADAVQNKKYIILNMHQILNFLAVADLSPTHWHYITDIFCIAVLFLPASVPQYPNAANTTPANGANVSFSTVISVLLATAANAAVLTYFGQFLHTEQVSSYIFIACVCVLVQGWCDIILQDLICMVFQISFYGSSWLY